MLGNGAKTSFYLFAMLMASIIVIMTYRLHMYDTLASTQLRSDPATFQRCACPKTEKYFQETRLTKQTFQNALERNDPFLNLPGLQRLNLRHPNLLLPPLDGSAQRCSLMPNVLQVSWASKHWQWLRQQNGKDLLLYSASYDNRTKTEPKGGVVRVVVMAEQHIKEPPQCLLWFDSQLEPVASPVVRAEYMDYHKPQLLPYLLTCQVGASWDNQRKAERLPPPMGVSLVYGNCMPATNLLKVNGAHNDNPSAPEYLRPSRFHGLPEVAVCGPALFYYQEDFSLRLVEWLEIMKALGVSKVFLYLSDVHPNIEKVLRLYESEGFVTLTDFRYPPPHVDEPLLRKLWSTISKVELLSLEKIYFSDCLLRNMHRFRYMAHFDPDEVPVLLRHDSLPHLVDYLKRQSPKANSFWLGWRFFPLGVQDESSTDDLLRVVTNSFHNSTRGSAAPTDPLPVNFDPTKKFFTILLNDRGLLRDKIKQHHNKKSIYDTSDVTTVLSHSEFICAKGPCKTRKKKQVSSSVAFTGHFRNPCSKRECSDLSLTGVMTPLRNLRPVVVPNVLDALRRLDFLTEQ